MSNHSNIANSRPKRKPRARPLPPDVTARNLAIEKKRRGEMNDNFLELARLLPGLGSTRRLTKVLIVNKTVEHVRQQRELCLAAAQDMQDLLAENRQLILEVNALRAQVMGPAAPLVQAKPMTEAMAQLAETKNHVFGTFPAGFGDNPTEDFPTTQSETSQEPYDMALSMNHSYPVPMQQTAIDLALENSQNRIEQMPPIVKR
ncbi:hypothetical protein FSARC_7523 [Fusarium sarcochroum]|uniref:BHLH domain-containing protein n=1 Tax=Fusarium sarcochroum TaxID=1208366 RepID=A0A8H4X860_9HYPO|nr:hypothetical protein FSARC_7523 [Fusarium sarcochroum]